MTMFMAGTQVLGQKRWVEWMAETFNLNPTCDERDKYSPVHLENKRHKKKGKQTPNC